MASISTDVPVLGSTVFRGAGRATARRRPPAKMDQTLHLSVDESLTVQMQASDWQCTVVAHRGLWAGGSAENSADAFRRAAEQNLAGECDVWLSADGVPMVIHDSDLDRTTTGFGSVTTKTAAHLQSLQLRGLSPSQGLPTLAQVADCVHLVEIKQNDSAELVREVMRIMHGKRWLLQSFDPANIDHALAIDPAVPFAFLVEEPAQLDYAIARGWRTHLDHEMLNDVVADRLNKAGIAMGVWTVNDLDTLNRVLPYQPIVVISDDPLMVRKQLTQAGVRQG